VLCHYSSDFFRGKIFELLSAAGAMVPEQRWYTNLYERGNTGCASIFIMLDEFLQTKNPQPGETIFCMVPESGRFNTAYMLLTVVDAND
jgi:3-oxoacyl-[acyl-carrier-protein] synthase-3